MNKFILFKSWLLFLVVCLLAVACQQGITSLTAAASIPPLNIPTTTPVTSVTTAPQIATTLPEPGINNTATPIPANNEPAFVIPTVTQPIPGMIGPDNFPPNVNPLTGEVVADPAVLAQRPLAIKISNSPPIVRPQSGLNSADLIFEHYAEGGVTRFTAVFYSQEADLVGSIRSGRLIDLEIPKMYDAAFAYSGSSGPVQEMIRNSNFFDRVISPDFGHGGFYRIEDPNKAFEHTLFTDANSIRFVLDQRGQNTPPNFVNGMTFHPNAPANGIPDANNIEIRYTSTNVFWQYNASSGRYTRWTDGQPHLDANTGVQLNFRNIIVIGAHHQETDFLEDMVGGGHYSIQIQVWGEGPVSIFRDGQRFEGRWLRQEENHMLTFHDLDGNLLPLSPGNTFFQLVPLGFEGLTVAP